MDGNKDPEKPTKEQKKEARDIAIKYGSIRLGETVSVCKSLEWQKLKLTKLKQMNPSETVQLMDTTTQKKKWVYWWADMKSQKQFSNSNYLMQWQGIKMVTNLQRSRYAYVFVRMMGRTYDF